MGTRVRTGSCSFSDFLELIREDQKADLIDGVIYLASPENLEHNELVLWLGTVLGLFVQERGLGRVMLNRVAFRLTDRTAPEPDIAFVRSERLAIVKSGYVDGPPDVAIEIVSPDSVDRDFEAKRELYGRGGVGEYWIVDPSDAEVTLLVRRGGVLEKASLEGFLLRSEVITGFTLDTQDLWARPLPSALFTVQRLLTAQGR